MIIEKINPCNSSSYDYKRHTLYPCIRAFCVLILLTLVILFKEGPIRHSWAAFSFILAYWCIEYPIKVRADMKKAEKDALKNV